LVHWLCLHFLGFSGALGFGGEVDDVAELALQIAVVGFTLALNGVEVVLGCVKENKTFLDSWGRGLFGHFFSRLQSL
jgi:hypothetical protein